MARQPSRYTQIIERVFQQHYEEGALSVPFMRSEFEQTATELGIRLPFNLGDIPYTFRYRAELPQSIRDKAPEGHVWVLRGTGDGRYCFDAVRERSFAPNANFSETRIPDATPGLIAMYALNDEQALLAKLRYNRLVDVFTGVTCYSLQSHLRTKVKGIGQIETDEVYIGVDRRGAHHVFPVQAKGGRDRLNVVQIEQDFAMCEGKFRDLICRPIGAQFMQQDVIALLEFEMDEGEVKIASERHYKLVPPEEVTAEDLAQYRIRPLT